jgi:hypothetical protein
LQNRKVQIWTYEKNRIFRTYEKQFRNSDIEIVVGIDAICDEIRKLKDDIISRKYEEKIIILLGMDRVCVDFDYVSAEDQKQSFSNLVNQKGEATSSEDLLKLEIINEFNKIWPEINARLVKEGKTEDEIRTAKKEKRKEIALAKGFELKPKTEENAKSSDSSTPDNSSESKDEEKKSGAYNAKNDFEFVVKQGSRLGYHFMMHLNALADLKTTGLKFDYFRYKLSFQVSVDDSRTLFRTRVGSTLPERICQFDDTIQQFSFRPYLHEGIGWDGWLIQDGNLISPRGEN